MDVNPYAAPTAVVEDVGALSAQDIESRKASRGQRLGAAMLDGVMFAVGMVISVMASVGFSRTNTVAGLGGTNVVFLIIGVMLMIGIVVANCVLLHRNAQTIGKRIVGIKVVRTDGSRIGLGRIILLRILPISLLSGIPMVGGLLRLADCLVIFGPERRCLHDLFADTVVINA
jgi:uncharacterized RDD family membrane protein YckC